MAKARNWVVTDFTQEDSLVLEVDTDNGTKTFRIVQFTATYAVNEVPQASCLVATGRNFRKLSEALGVDTYATIHEFAPLLSQMQEARVYAKIGGEKSPSSAEHPDGEMWPTEADGSPKRVILFTGYLAGLSRRKVSGKIQPMLTLINKLSALSFSSCLSSQIHPASAFALTTPACFRPLLGAGAGTQATTLGELVGSPDLAAMLKLDFWVGIKTLLCKITQDEPVDVAAMGVGMDPASVSLGDGSNSRAQEALNMIEGPIGDCGEEVNLNSFANAYEHGLKLEIEDYQIPMIADSAADFICRMAFEPLEQCTMWNLLLSRIFPAFGLAIIPLADRALVVADTPSYDRYWKHEISPDDYDEVNADSTASIPIRQVIVYGSCRFSTDGSLPAMPIAVGEFHVDQIKPGDGTVTTMAAPGWLEKLSTVSDYTNTSQSIKDGTEIPGSGKDNSQVADIVGPAATIAEKAPGIYAAVAHNVLVSENLKSRSCTIRGKLRFDISPGSIVKIRARGDVFLAGLDASEVDLFAYVSRVTININAEAPMANTIFQLTHVRTTAENDALNSPRTCVDKHPMFVNPVFSGAPLVPDLET